MVLSFKNQFVDKILDGSKIHTIREDKHNRWQVGSLINFATGVRTKDYKQFHQDICTGVQQIIIKPETKEIFIPQHDNSMTYVVNGKMTPIGVYQLAIHDGFNHVSEFWEFFNKPFEGNIIHWTDFKY